MLLSAIWNSTIDLRHLDAFNGLDLDWTYAANGASVLGLGVSPDLAPPAICATCGASVVTADGCRRLPNGGSDEAQRYSIDRSVRCRATRRSRHRAAAKAAGRCGSEVCRQAVARGFGRRGAGAWEDRRRHARPRGERDGEPASLPQPGQEDRVAHKTIARRNGIDAQSRLCILAVGAGQAAAGLLAGILRLYAGGEWFLRLHVDDGDHGQRNAGGARGRLEPAAELPKLLLH